MDRSLGAGGRIDAQYRTSIRTTSTIHMALIADIDIPELPTGKAAIVAAHLENKCSPSCRRTQMQALLEELKGEKILCSSHET